MGEECWDCGGVGFYHDCGEDTCCCADPDEQDMVPCRTCGGTGWIPEPPNQQEQP